MKKILPISIMVLLAVCGFVKNSASVMLSHDTVYLYEGRNRITDNSVICKETNTYSKATYLYLYENGSHEYTQTSAARDLILFKTDNEDILSHEEWNKLNEEGSDSIKTYKDYLEEEAARASYSHEITIPPRGDHKTYNVPKNGMTGGTIGSDRVFAIDLSAGVIKPLQKEEFGEQE